MVAIQSKTLSVSWKFSIEILSKEMKVADTGKTMYPCVNLWRRLNIGSSARSMLEYCHLLCFLFLQTFQENRLTMWRLICYASQLNFFSSQELNLKFSLCSNCFSFFWFFVFHPWEKFFVFQLRQFFIKESNNRWREVKLSLWFIYSKRYATLF